MRKLLITSCIILCGCISAFGQAPANYIKYDYDAAGNRIARRYIEVLLPQRRSAAAPFDTTGVEVDLNELKVTIYPNPTRGVVIACLSAFSPNVIITYILFNADGKKLQQLNAESDRTPIDLSNYPPSAYILKVLANKKEIEFKIIKK
ncbi:MAG TPA: T9SS type A sorting domain-containing protein [Bacteroidales bacterium]|nr:T9SS type A sorting domain-containing protein [Bacteroidales bacterium]